MSDKIVNLNKVRKAKAKATAKARADENAIAFGRSKSEKATDKITAARAKKHLDDHERET